jgi:hypothetical protein
MDKAHHGLQPRKIFEQVMLTYLPLLLICYQLHIMTRLSSIPFLKTHFNSNLATLQKLLVYAKDANPLSELFDVRYGNQ